MVIFQRILRCIKLNALTSLSKCSIIRSVQYSGELTESLIVNSFFFFLKVPACIETTKCNSNTRIGNKIKQKPFKIKENICSLKISRCRDIQTIIIFISIIRGNSGQSMEKVAMVDIFALC